MKSLKVGAPLTRIDMFSTKFMNTLILSHLHTKMASVLFLFSNFWVGEVIFLLKIVLLPVFIHLYNYGLDSSSLSIYIIMALTVRLSCLVSITSAFPINEDASALATTRQSIHHHLILIILLVVIVSIIIIIII